ncbi:MAG: hypothetical protein AAFN11_11770, partial [Chloroflexota bacterium]
PQIKLSLPDGSQHIFTPTDNSRSIFRSRILHSWTLARAGDVIGTWEARTSEGVVYRFDEAGRLQSIHDAQGNVLVFSPIPQGRLGRYGATGGFFVSDAFGRRIEVYTNSDNLIIAVRDMQGRDLSYGYDDNNQLSQVTYRGTQGTATYSYNAEGRLIELADSQSPYHQAMTFAYNERGQVATWTLVGDDTTRLTYQISYDNQRTTQTQRINDNDEREQVWIFDNDFRLLQATPSAVIGVYSYVYQGDLLTRIVQPDDAELALSYDDRGYLTIINDPISAQNYTFSYEETVDNQVRLLIVNVPNVTFPYMQLSYDADGRLITIQRALDETTSTTTRYRYDDPRLPYHLTEIAHGIETTDPVLRRYHYDNFGYVSAIEVGQTSSVDIDEYAQRWSLVHDITGRLRLVTDSSGVTTAIGWEDAVGEIATITVDDMLTDTQYSYRYDYDEAGNLLAITEPDNITTRYVYDALNRLTQVIEPLTVPTGEDTPTRTTTYVYNVAGDVETLVLPTGVAQTYTYDERGRLVSRSSLGRTVRYDINNTNTRYRIDTVPNASATFLFNANGQLDAINLPRVNGSAYDFGYDSRGNLASVSNNLSGASRLVIRADYNAQSWVQATSIGNFDGGLVTAFDYDVLGNVVAVTDPLGNALSNRVDGAGRVTQVTLPNGDVIGYAYDIVGDLVGVTDAEGNTSQFSYDGVSQLRLIT